MPGCSTSWRPGVYKGKGENQPSGLFEQLDALRECGYGDVDCYYKYGIFAVFGGIKSEQSAAR
jgi:tRNA (cmo5U34)-methyltransferase